jgi:hypothetical protein
MHLEQVKDGRFTDEQQGNIDDLFTCTKIGALKACAAARAESDGTKCEMWTQHRSMTFTPTLRLVSMYRLPDCGSERARGKDNSVKKGRRCGKTPEWFQVLRPAKDSREVRVRVCVCAHSSTVGP